MRLLGCGLAVLLASAAPSSAHDLEFTYTVVVLGADPSFRADVTCDLDAIASPVFWESSGFRGTILRLRS